MKKLNINEIVKIKPTQEGLKALDDWYRQYNVWMEFKRDEEGFIEIQLWQVMQIFGEHMCNGCDLVIETTIKIDESKFA